MAQPNNTVTLTDCILMDIFSFLNKIYLGIFYSSSSGRGLGTSKSSKNVSCFIATIV